MIPLFLLSIAQAAVPVDRTFDVAADVAVDVELVCGTVTVRGSTGQQVHVTGTVEPDLDAIDFRASNRRVSIEVDDRKDACAWLTIEAPGGASLRGESVSAGFDIDALAGSVRLETVSGVLVVAGSPSEVEAESVSGRLKVTGAPGRVSGETVSGKVTVETSRASSVTVESVSSNIEIRAEALDEVKASSVSGKITVQAAVGRSVDIDTVSGNVDLVVPAAQGMNLTTNSFSGRVHNALGGVPTGVVGDGSARVEIETFSGNIDIEPR